MPFDHGFMAVTVAFEPTVGVGEICPTSVDPGVGGRPQPCQMWQRQRSSRDIPQQAPCICGGHHLCGVKLAIRSLS